MTDGKLAVIGLGSIGSMALWQASRLSGYLTGFEAASPARGRSAAGGDIRLFQILYRGIPDYYPILERSRSLWAELESETGQNILARCGGISLGAANGSYLSALGNHPHEWGRARNPQPRGNGRPLPAAQPPPG